MSDTIQDAEFTSKQLTRTTHLPALAEGMKVIDGFDRYAVKDDGTIWTCVKKGPNTSLFLKSWKKMTAKIDRYGYPVIGLRKDGRKRFFTIHRLVLLAFVGPCPEGMEARHIMASGMIAEWKIFVGIPH